MVGLPVFRSLSGSGLVGLLQLEASDIFGKILRKKLGQALRRGLSAIARLLGVAQVGAPRCLLNEMRKTRMLITRPVNKQVKL